MVLERNHYQEVHHALEPAKTAEIDCFAAFQNLLMNYANSAEMKKEHYIDKILQRTVQQDLSTNTIYNTQQNESTESSLKSQSDY